MAMKSTDLTKAVELMKNGHRNEAKLLFTKILRKNPNQVDANYLLGALCVEEGSVEKGEKLLRKAHRMMPKSPYILNNLGNAYKRQSRFEDALDCYKKALELKPDLPEANGNIGMLYALSGNHEKARSHFAQAEKIQPGMETVRVGLSMLERQSGNFRKARKDLQKMIDSGLRDYPTLTSYAEAILHDNPKVSDLEKLLDLTTPLIESGEQALKLSRTEQSALCYLLGDINDRLKRYSKAFHYYEKANKNNFSDYNLKGLLKEVSCKKENFSKEVFQSRDNDNGGNLIFIVGMPRSGSTLVEQILCSHPDVSSLGESDYFSRSLDLLSENTKNSPLSDTQIKIVSHQYYTMCRENHPNGKIFTDKTLPNHLHLGHIKQVFPKAKIIHCMRNPLDTCLSCFFHNFIGKHDYTNNLTTLGKYFNAYKDMMDFWNEVLYGEIYNLTYEELIKDLKRETKNLLDFCNLNFNRSCLKFYKNKRIVTTASYYQVRKPIFKTSVNRSDPYRVFLTPLEAEIKSLT